MSIRLVQEVLELRGLGSSAKHILHYLALRANDSGECWCSLSRIMEETELSKNTVCNKIRFLEENGLLKRHSKAGKGGNNLYQLTIEFGSKLRQSLAQNCERSQNYDCRKIEKDTGSKLRQSLAQNCATIRHKDPERPIKKTKAKKEVPDWFDEFFEMFWQDYPQGRGSKKPAREKLHRIIRDAKDPEKTRTEIMQGLGRWKKSRTWTDGYVCHATTFLNQARWEDDPEPAKPNLAQTGRVMPEDHFDELFDNFDEIYGKKTENA
ncbi:MAG: helix-turn-helix domain-containing protein [Epibacterium sp.]|nr:helix-turn-helix domain-containing protein [Epibacterium sp.]NQX73799.1 helix-turn-helix domain-containing protein [Epibacterium sp.]